MLTDTHIMLPPCSVLQHRTIFNKHRACARCGSKAPPATSRTVWNMWCHVAGRWSRDHESCAVWYRVSHEDLHMACSSSCLEMSAKTAQGALFFPMCLLFLFFPFMYAFKSRRSTVLYVQQKHKVHAACLCIIDACALTCPKQEFWTYAIQMDMFCYLYIYVYMYVFM